MTTFIDFESDTVSCFQQDEFAIINLKAGAFNLLLNLEEKNKILELLDSIDKSPEIRGLVLINSDEYPGDVKYQELLCQVMQDEYKSSYASGVEVSRMRHAVAQLSLQAVKFRKPLVAGVQGRISGEFLGNILPFDFRLATKDTVFMFPNVKLGFPPAGVLTYYLERFLGPAKATEVLMLGEDIYALDAKALGLVTGVVEGDELLEQCLKKLAAVCRVPIPTLSATRSLLHPEITVIEKYLDRSFKTEWKALNSMGKVNS